MGHLRGKGVLFLCRLILIFVWIISASHLASASEQNRGLLEAFYLAEGNTKDALGRFDLDGKCSFADGKYGQSFSFNGVNESLKSQKTELLNGFPLTLEAWIFPLIRDDGVEFPANTIGNGISALGGRGFGVNVSPKGSDFSVHHPGGVLHLTQLNIQSNRWIHAAVVYGLDTIESYLDGNQVLSIPVNGGKGGTNVFHIGSRPSPQPNSLDYFRGLIDEIGIHHAALTSNEVKVVYDRGSRQSSWEKQDSAAHCTNFPQGLTSWWQFDGNSSNAKGDLLTSMVGTIAFQEGISRQALRISEEKSWAEIKEWPEVDDFSVLLWVNPQGPQTAYATLLDNSQFGEINWAVSREERSGTSRYWWQIGHKKIHFDLPEGWHFLGLTHNKQGDAEVFIDGLLVTSAIDTHIVHGHEKTLRIGYSLYRQQQWRGLVDELQFYNRPLTEKEILGVYRAQRDGIAIIPRLEIHLAWWLLALVLTLGLLAGKPWRLILREKKAPTHSYFRIIFPAVLLCATGLLSSAALSSGLQKWALKQDRKRFSLQARTITGVAINRYEHYTLMLHRIRDVFAQGEMSQTKWRNLMLELDPALEYHGFFDFLYAPKVFPWEKLDLESRYSTNLNQKFHIHSSEAPGTNSFRLFHLPVTHHYYSLRIWDVQPEWQNYGKDLMQDPLLQKEIESAITSRRIYISKLIDYDEKLRKFRGFAIIIPVFDLEKNTLQHDFNDPRLPSQDLDEKWPMLRQIVSFQGALLARFDMAAYMKDILAHAPQEIGLAIYDSDKRMPENLVFESPHAHADLTTKKPYLTEEIKVPYGQALYFVFYTLPTFDANSPRHWSWVAAVAGSSITLLITALLAVQIRARLRQAAINRDLRRSRDTLETALRDRERLSRDLHDGTIQSVFSATLSLKQCQRLLNRNPERAEEQLHATIGDLNGVVIELREFLSQLEPQVLKGQNLGDALSEFVSRASQRLGINISLSFDEKVNDFSPPSTSVHLLNIVRESVHNAVKHGNPESILVRVSVNDTDLQLEVENDGRGFLSNKASHPEGQGLKNMASRAEEIHGKLKITSTPGKTTVKVLMPIPGAET